MRVGDANRTKKQTTLDKVGNRPRLVDDSPKEHRPNQYGVIACAGTALPSPAYARSK